MSNKSPPPYVSEAAAFQIVVKTNDSKVGEWLTSTGFASAGEEKYILSCATDEEKAHVFAKLRDWGVCFSYGKEWNPSDVFDYLREKKLLSGSFKEIAWKGPGNWLVHNR